MNFSNKLLIIFHLLEKYFYYIIELDGFRAYFSNRFHVLNIFYLLKMNIVIFIIVINVVM